MTGKMILSNKGISQTGDNEQVMNLGNMPAGMYQVVFLLDNHREVKQLIVN